jgi:replicative DNA helicase
MTRTYLAEAETIGFCFRAECSALYVSWLIESAPIEAFRVGTFRAIRKLIEDMSETGTVSWPFIYSKAESIGLSLSKDDVSFLQNKTAANDIKTATSCAQIVIREHRIAVKRAKLVEIAEKGANACTNKEQDEWEKTAPVEISEAFLETENTTATIDVVGQELLEKLDKEASGVMPFIPSGYDEIDSLISGFYRSDLYIMAARPSMGKTAVVGNLTVSMSTMGYRGLFFSAEMSRWQILKRMVQADRRIHKDAFIARQADVYRSIVELSRLPIIFDDSPKMTPEHIVSTAKRVKALGDLDYIVVDYLQMLTTKSKAGETRDERIGNVTRLFKSTAKELDVAFICLSQLNRELERRDDKRPKLADLRESGAIEQDADTIMFLYRDGVYNKEALKEKIEIIVGKQRNGEIGSVAMRLELQFQNLKGRER